MAATQYQILYRYLNTKNNTFVTNETTEEYEKVFEFYNDKHKIMIGTPNEKVTAETEKQDLIVNGNLSSNPNYNMLFRYDGVKRKSKKVWVAEQTGYVIKDWAGIVNQISPAGDYSGNYVLIGGATPGSAKVVAKTKPVTSAITVATSNSEAQNGSFYTEAEMMKKIDDATIASLTGSAVSDYGTPSKSTSIRNGGSSSYPTYATLYTGPVSIDTEIVLTNYGYDGVYGNVSQSGLYTSIVINPNQIETCVIPAHYEDVNETPYVICDTYERIETSPWLVFANINSLPDALEKAKKLVEILGIENVKLIKNVAIDEFIKIK